MPHALLSQDGLMIDWTADATYAAGTVIELPDGRAGVTLCDVESGKAASVRTAGVYTVAKTSGVTILHGAPLWWDHSAGVCTPVPPLVTGDRDYYLGVAAADATASAATVRAVLNVHPYYVIDCQRDGGDTAIVKTVVGSTTVEIPNLISRGGTLEAYFGGTAEAQKVDWLSKRSFTVGSRWILEAVIEVVVNATADVADLSIGVANATHPSDADLIAESAFFHFDLGGNFNIYAESDDGTTEVNATDTLLDWQVGTPIHLVLDGRTPTDVRYYINGVEVLGATPNLGDIRQASGPLKALFHLEKTANGSPGIVHLDMLRVRTQQ